MYKAPTYWNMGDAGIVMVQQGNAPWGGLASGSGINYISIQGSGAFLQQTITGLTPGQSYEISFLCSSRPGYGDDETFNVQVDGQVIWETGHPPDSAFGLETAIFTARINTAVLRIENDSPGGDQSVLIDAITIAQMDLGAALTMANPSFELDTVTEHNGNFQCKCTRNLLQPLNLGKCLTKLGTDMEPQGWRASVDVRGSHANRPDTVVALNGNSPWGGLSAADATGLDSDTGNYYLSIQGSGAYVEQTLRGLQAGTVYEVRFLAAERPGYGGDETLTVKIDGFEVWESTHPTDAFQVYRVAFTAQSPDGTAVLRFENDSPTGDRSIFIDAVSVQACYTCVPSIDLSTCVGAYTNDVA